MTLEIQELANQIDGQRRSIINKLRATVETLTQQVQQDKALIEGWRQET